MTNPTHTGSVKYIVFWEWGALHPLMQGMYISSPITISCEVKKLFQILMSNVCVYVCVQCECRHYNLLFEQKNLTRMQSLDLCQLENVTRKSRELYLCQGF